MLVMGIQVINDAQHTLLHPDTHVLCCLPGSIYIICLHHHHKHILSIFVLPLLLLFLAALYIQ